jgi:hypothetical protein
MKYLLKFLSVLCFIYSGFQGFSQTVYTQRLENIDGDSIGLHAMAGNKMMFIVLPLSKDSLSAQVIAFAGGVHNIKVIGILSYEAGYTLAKRDSIRAMYATSNIYLTAGMYIQKGASQSPFMQWLTDYNKNNHFNKDAAGIGTKFFVNEQGILYSFLSPAVPLSSPVVAKVINTSVAH